MDLSVFLSQFEILFQVSKPAMPFFNQRQSNFKIIYGDLFSRKDISLGHCVSKDFFMRKGIAKDFRKKFRRVEELKSQNIMVGGVAILKHQGRFLYYLVTKEKYNDEPTYGDLQKSLLSMKCHALKHNVSAINLPKIGCGLDGLHWPTVSNMLKDTFFGTEIMITVYILP